MEHDDRSPILRYDKIVTCLRRAVNPLRDCAHPSPAELTRSPVLSRTTTSNPHGLLDERHNSNCFHTIDVSTYRPARSVESDTVFFWPHPIG